MDRQTEKQTLRFSHGKVVATPGVLEAIPRVELMQALSRHLRGDWGEVSAQDAAANDRALAEDTRLFSAYRSSQERKFWIITEADRSATTVLLPEEY